MRNEKRETTRDGMKNKPQLEEGEKGTNEYRGGI